LRVLRQNIKFVKLMFVWKRVSQMRRESFLSNCKIVQSGWKEKIVKLKPDHEEWIDENESVLRRGDLPNFPEKDKFILIAPLQAIERGHNILAEVEVENGRRKVAARIFDRKFRAKIPTRNLVE
jgi:hypothetical protein